MVEFANMATCTHTSSGASSSPTGWQSILADSVRSPEELCRLLDLPPALAVEVCRATEGFSLLAPRTYLARIRRGDLSDPLLLQILPRAAETIAAPGYSTDPLGEAHTGCGASLLQKYHGRILMVTTGSCAVHCRFCFRRHFPYAASVESTDWQALALGKIAQNRTIHEVVLSGGDPLTLSDRSLGRFVGQLAEIPHLRRLRVHSRLPVMIPQRITDELLALLAGGRLTPSLVVHVNHPAEIDVDVAEAFARLVEAGIPVLSQSVLLRGVNDRADVLAELYERLADLRVMPYYLHQLDAVAGAAHFEVPIATGRSLIAELRRRLPGYAVPRYVRETRGGTNKEILA